MRFLLISATHGRLAVNDELADRVRSDAASYGMKGMALDDRLKEKDAWDIYYCLLAYPGGIDALVEEFRPHLAHGLVREGLAKIAKHFSSLKALGPKFVADFEETADSLHPSGYSAACLPHGAGSQPCRLYKHGCARRKYPLRVPLTAYRKWTSKMLHWVQNMGSKMKRGILRISY